MGMTTFSGPVRSMAGFITGPDAYVPVSAQNGTATAADNGKTIQLAYVGATGTFTLPPANSDNVGLVLNFSVPANLNPTGFKFKTSTALTTNAELFLGLVTSTPAIGGAVVSFAPNGTSNDVMNLGGAAGGSAGTAFSVTCTAVNRWTVSGTLLTVGAPVTPFADA